MITEKINLVSLPHLDLSSPEERVVEGHGRADRVLVRELDVGEPLGVAVKLVAQDGHAIDGAAPVEVLRGEGENIFFVAILSNDYEFMMF